MFPDHYKINNRKMCPPLLHISVVYVRHNTLTLLRHIGVTHLRWSVTVPQKTKGQNNNYTSLGIYPKSGVFVAGIHDIGIYL